MKSSFGSLSYIEQKKVMNKAAKLANKEQSKIMKQGDIKDWKIEFDIKFDHFNDIEGASAKKICDSSCEKTYGLEDVKDFIESLITEARHECLQEINMAKAYAREEGRQTERELIKGAFCKRFVETIETDDIKLIDLNNRKYVNASVEDIEKFFSSLGEQ